MNWTAPDVVHILEQRLRTARLELMEDPRIRNAHEAQSRESINFLVQLVEEKVAAAARAGLEAVEASLRLAATDALLAESVPVETVRRRLEDAGRPLLRPARPETAALARLGWAPRAWTGLFLAVWLAAVLGAWAVYRFAGVWCVLLVGAGAFPATLLYVWRDSRLAALKRETVGDLPSRTVRHYMDLVRAGVVEYARAVERIAREETGR